MSTLSHMVIDDAGAERRWIYLYVDGRFQEKRPLPDPVKDWAAVLAPFQWHKETLCYVVLGAEKGKWLLLSLPAVAEAKDEDALLAAAVAHALAEERPLCLSWQKYHQPHSSEVGYAVFAIAHNEVSTAAVPPGCQVSTLPYGSWLAASEAVSEGYGVVSDGFAEWFLLKAHGQCLGVFADTQALEAEAHRNTLERWGILLPSKPPELWTAPASVADLSVLRPPLRRKGVGLGLAKPWRVVAVGFLIWTLILFGLSQEQRHLEAELAMNRQALASVAAQGATPQWHYHALLTYAAENIPQGLRVEQWQSGKGRVVLQGFAENISLLADYCRRLEESGLCERVRLHDCRQGEAQVAFVLHLQLAGAEEGQDDRS